MKLTRNTTALEAYMAKFAEARQLLALLNDHVEAHGDVLPDDVDWTNVGDAGLLVDLLKEPVAALLGADATAPDFAKLVAARCAELEGR